MSAESRNDRESYKYILLFVLLGLAVRLDFLFASNFGIESDEAIVGLMAKHILDGEPTPIFYYGQHYMGSFEPILASALFSVFGVSSVALKLVPLLFSLALIALIYRLAEEVGNSRTAKISAFLCALPPAVLIVWSAKARGGFIELVVLGTWALLKTVRVLKSDSPRKIDLAAIGLILGFAWWVNNQVLYFISAIGLFIGIKVLTSSKGLTQKALALAVNLAIGLVAFLVGGLPYWLYNLQHDFASFEMFKGAGQSALWEHITGLFSTAMPILLGAQRFWGGSELFAGATTFVLAVYVIVLLLVLTWLWQGGANPITLNSRVRQPVQLLIAFVLFACVIFVLSDRGNLVLEPRYLLPLYPALFVLVGVVVEKLTFSSSLVLKASGLLIGLSVLGVNICSAYLGGRALPGEPFVYNGERVSKDHTELLAWLKSNGYSLVKTNYWIGYRLAFETKEQVKFLIFGSPGQIRIDKYEEQGRNVEDSKIPMVLVPTQAQVVEKALSAMGYQFSTIDLSHYRVIYNLRTIFGEEVPIPNSFLRASSSNESKSSAFSLDGDVLTRWGSAAPQAPGMTFTIELDSPRVVSGLRYEMGSWRHDYPRGLRIELEAEDGTRVKVLTTEESQAIIYFIEDQDHFSVVFPPHRTKRVILTQTRADPIFDWSIAELKLYSDSQY